MTEKQRVAALKKSAAEKRDAAAAARADGFLSVASSLDRDAVKLEKLAEQVWQGIAEAPHQAAELRRGIHPGAHLEPQSWAVLVVDMFDPNFPGSVIETHKVKGELSDLDSQAKQILDGWMEKGDRLVKQVEKLEGGTTQIVYLITTDGGDSDIAAVCRRVA